MNDYFSNLSVRSFDLTEDIPLVSPRVPSLFEPSQELWGVSIEMPSWPSVNHRPNDEIPPASLATKVGEESKGSEQAPERYRRMDTAAPAAPEDFSRLYGSSKEILTGTAERAPSDHEPAVIALRRQDMRNVTILQTPAKPNDIEKRSFDPHVGDDMKEKPATKKTTVTPAEQSVPIPREKGEPLSFRERREEWTKQPRSKSRKERPVVENVLVKGGVEWPFDPDVSSGTDRGERDNVIMPLTTQQPPQPLIKPIFNLWKNTGHREAPAKTEPTIQVTIGRVEVRATTAPVQNRPRPKAPASMSLDEYLRGRDGGRR